MAPQVNDHGRTLNFYGCRFQDFARQVDLLKQVVNPKGDNSLHTLSGSEVEEFCMLINTITVELWNTGKKLRERALTHTEDLTPNENNA